jgi:hypothetical protein
MESTLMPVDKNTLAVGCVVSYGLFENQSPMDTHKLRRGKVLKAIINRPRLLDSVIVESLEKGYEKETEFVLLEQIVAIEPQEEE